MDIIERLRAKRVRGRPGFYNPDELCQEAADQIARLKAERLTLRAALQKIADDDFGPDDGDLWSEPGLMPWQTLSRKVLNEQSAPFAGEAAPEQSARDWVNSQERAKDAGC